MENKFTFAEKSHKYYLNGKPLTGITTILGVIAKPFLIQWSADEAVKYIDNALTEQVKNNNEGNLLEWLGENWPQVMKEAREAHRKKKEDAGQKGIDVHALIEERIKGAIKNNDGFIDPEGIDENEQVQHFLSCDLSTFSIKRSIGDLSFPIQAPCVMGH